MTAPNRLRIARIVVPGTLSNKGWMGYAPLGRPLTRRERFRGSRIHRILTLPVAVMRAPAELGEK